MSGHTPGPWHADDTEGRVQTSDRVCIAQAIDPYVHGHPILSPAEVRANARLIAAAPDQHEAISLWREYWLHDRDCAECHRVRRIGQACAEQVQRFERAWNANERAIGKAEGRD